MKRIIFILICCLWVGNAVCYGTMGMAHEGKKTTTEIKGTSNEGKKVATEMKGTANAGKQAATEGKTTAKGVTPKKKSQPRPKVALVISGGGAKGAAAIGALKYIEKAGIPIDLIVGTSAGAIVGSLYSVGYTAEAIDSIYRAQDWKQMFLDVAPPRKKWVRPKDFIPGVMSGKKFAIRLDSLLGHRSCHFDSLPIPFRCMSVDALHFREICMDRGILAKAVRASMSVPIAFRPVEVDSMLLVDGGLLNNLPVDVARGLGADIVIAIDLMDEKRAEQEGRDEMISRGFPAIIAWKFARPDLKKYHENRKDADLLIHPDVQGFTSTSFAPEETDQLIRHGEWAGLDAWERLMEIKKRCNK